MRAAQRGIGLLEVLVAVVIVSIGFLASARMQVESMRASREAYALSQAKFVLVEMSERMRANRPGLDAGAYDALETVAGAPAPACVSDGTRCSPEALARADLHAWSARLHGAPGASDPAPVLPGRAGAPPLGRVARDGSDGWTVTLEWHDPAEDTTRSIATRVIR